LEKTLPIRCVVNPEVGLEREWRAVPPPPVRRSVLVVGGGPAGMEAAATAAQRGHRAVLLESSDRLGGQVNLVRRLSGRERFGLLVDELALLVRDAGVEVRLGASADAESIASEPWDEIVIATGSRPPAPAYQGALTTWQALDADSLRHRVVIYDDEGFWPAASIAEHLALAGRTVVVATPLQAPFPNIDTYTKLALFERYSHLDITLLTMRRMVGFDDAGVVLADTLNGAEHVLPGQRSLVMATPPVANDALFRALTARLPDVPIHLVGDAFAPRTALEATYEGRAAGTMVGISDIADWQGPPIRLPYRGAASGGDLLRPGLDALVTPLGAR
jgi:hypothetical protein